MNLSYINSLARPATALLLVLGALLSGGCSSLEVKPWVSPFERNKLADPIMSFGRDASAAAFMHHVYQVREGARGAEGGAGGGCGCN